MISLTILHIFFDLFNILVNIFIEPIDLFFQILYILLLVVDIQFSLFLPLFITFDLVFDKLLLLDQIFKLLVHSLQLLLVLNIIISQQHFFTFNLFQQLFFSINLILYLDLIQPFINAPNNNTLIRLSTTILHFFQHLFILLHQIHLFLLITFYFSYNFIKLSLPFLHSYNILLCIAIKIPFQLDFQSFQFSLFFYLTIFLNHIKLLFQMFHLLLSHLYLLDPLFLLLLDHFVSMFLLFYLLLSIYVLPLQLVQIIVQLFDHRRIEYINILMINLNIHRSLLNLIHRMQQVLRNRVTNNLQLFQLFVPVSLINNLPHITILDLIPRNI